MLRSAAPMKTLRSRNIDLSDIGSSVSSKRGLATSPLTVKRQRLDEQRCTSSPVPCKKKLKTIEPKVGFLKSLLGHGESDLFCDADSKILGDVSLPISNKRNYQRMSAFSNRLRDRKHKSLSPLMMSKWRDSAVSLRDRSSDGKARSVSDSELSPMLSSLVTHSRRMREQRGAMSMLPPKRKFKGAISTLTQRSMTLRQNTDSLLGRVNDTCNVTKSVQN